MKRNKERKRIPNRRSKKRKFGLTDKHEGEEEEIKKPEEDESVKKQLSDISNVTGFKIMKKKGFLSKIIEKFDDVFFPKQTEEQISKLSIKKKFLLYLLDTGIGKYISKHYAHLINNGDFLKRMVASNNTQV